MIGYITLGTADLEKAAERIATFAEITPILTCSAISEMVGAELLFKCENFQKRFFFKNLKS